MKVDTVKIFRVELMSEFNVNNVGVYQKHTDGYDREQDDDDDDGRDDGEEDNKVSLK